MFALQSSQSTNGCGTSPNILQEMCHFYQLTYVLLVVENKEHPFTQWGCYSIFITTCIFNCFLSVCIRLRRSLFEKKHLHTISFMYEYLGIYLSCDQRLLTFIYFKATCIFKNVSNMIIKPQKVEERTMLN